MIHGPDVSGDGVVPAADVVVSGAWPGTAHQLATYFRGMLPEMTVAPAKTPDGAWSLRVYDAVTQTLLIAVPGRDRWVVSGWGLRDWNDPDMAALALEVAASSQEPEVTVEWTLDTLRALAFERRSAGVEVLDAVWQLLRELCGDTQLQAVTRHLRARIPGLEITTAGGVVPFQATGTWWGHPWYFRLRWDVASLKVGGDSPVVKPLWSAEMPHTSGEMPDHPYLHNEISWQEFEDVFCALAISLKKAPFHYLFARTGHRQSADTEPQWGGYGNSPAEAFESLLLRVHGFVDEGYLTPGMEFDPVPVNVDDRVFPATAPTFAVLPSERLSE